MTDNVQPTTPATVVPPDGRDQRIAELEAERQQAKAENAALKAQIVQLQQWIAELERAGKRQAMPFARDEHKADPKKLGRKAGQDPFSYRAKPASDEVDETKEAPLDGCPECGGPRTDLKEHEQFVLNLPEVRPQITRYVTHSGYCGRCARRVRSRHPAQISAATGAAGGMIGPRGIRYTHTSYLLRSIVG